MGAKCNGDFLSCWSTKRYVESMGVGAYQSSFFNASYYIGILFPLVVLSTSIIFTYRVPQMLDLSQVRRAFLEFASNCLEERLSTVMPCDGLQAHR